MADDIIIHRCGPSCPEGEHDWTGPTKEFESLCRCVDETMAPDATCRYCKGHGTYVSGEAATCAKCGLDAMSHSFWFDDRQTVWDHIDEMNAIDS